MVGVEIDRDLVGQRLAHEVGQRRRHRGGPPDHGDLGDGGALRRLAAGDVQQGWGDGDQPRVAPSDSLRRVLNLGGGV